MIFGIGTDIVDINRIKKMNSVQKFAQKILGNQEMDIFESIDDEKKIYFLSKQFAAKEAFSKALGTGINKSLRFKDIEILRDEKGKPFFNFNSTSSALLSSFGIVGTHVSLSDEKDNAIAFVILEK